MDNTDTGNTIYSELFPDDDDWTAHQNTPKPKLYVLGADALRDVPADTTNIRTIAVGTGQRTQIVGRRPNNVRRVVVVRAISNTVAICAGNGSAETVTAVGAAAAAIPYVPDGVILDASDNGNREYIHESCNELWAFCTDSTLTNNAIVTVFEDGYYDRTGNHGQQ